MAGVPPLWGHPSAPLLVPSSRAAAGRAGIGLREVRTLCPPTRGVLSPTRWDLSPRVLPVRGRVVLTPPCRSEEPVPVPSPVQPGSKRRRELDSEDEAVGGSGGSSRGLRALCPCRAAPWLGGSAPSPPQVQNRPLQPPAPRRTRPKSRSPRGGGNVSGVWRRKRRIEGLSLPSPGLFSGCFVGFKAVFKGVAKADGASQPCCLPPWFYPKLLFSFSFFYCSDTF